jgi:hypothetical protein
MPGWDKGKLVSTIRGRVQLLFSIEIVVGPSAGWKCAGANLRLIAIPDESLMGISRGRKALRSSVVGRFFDTFDKDAKRRVRPAILCKVRNPAASATERSEKWNG